MLANASYHSSTSVVGQLMKQCARLLAIAACFYYLISAATLPFVNTLWIGEAPLLALLQLPKAFVKSMFQEALLKGLHIFGWSAGSASPDYAMTHPWAMVLMAVAPALVLVLLFSCWRSARPHAGFVLAVIVCAVIDGAVTISFDVMSSLKLFNGSFF